MLLNIGLARNDGKPDNLPSAVLNQLLDRVIEWTLVVSNTENTLIVEVFPDLSYAALWVLCESLAQDCVAVYHGYTRWGQLVGPKAHEWGAFDPAHFTLLDGTRLSQSGGARQEEPAQADSLRQLPPI
jgi:hypothetical protein